MSTEYLFERAYITLVSLIYSNSPFQNRVDCNRVKNDIRKCDLDISDCEYDPQGPDNVTEVLSHVREIYAFACEDSDGTNTTQQQQNR